MTEQTQTPELDENRLIAERRAKLDKIRQEKGIAFPNNFRPSDKAQDLHDKYDAIEKADLLYNEIDRNKLFVGTAAEEDRSRMNICFVMTPEYKELEADFLKFATERGMVGIKGHRSVGGFRASCYNALPKESVQALIDCMQEFEKLH